jgi:Zn-finger protein
MDVNRVFCPLLSISLLAISMLGNSNGSNETDVSDCHLLWIRTNAKEVLQMTIFLELCHKRGHITFAFEI